MTFHGSDTPGDPAQPPPPGAVPSGWPQPEGPAVPSGQPAPPESPAAGMLSPDGRFQWNGFQWMPLVPYKPPGRGTGWKIAGGCCLGLVVAVIAVVIFFVHLLSNAPLASFPGYPGATQNGISISSNTGGSVESTQWQVSAPADTVQKWYATNLRGPWVIDHGGTTDSSTWTFHKVGTTGSGTIKFIAQGPETTTVNVVFTY